MLPSINKKALNKLLLKVIALSTLSSDAYAEDRVIEETLIYKDPTVAHGGQWVSGMSVDYFRFTNSSSTLTLSNGSTASASLSYSQPGISIFAGYGDITVLASYKSGSGNTTYNPGAIGLSSKFTESEIDVRWLMRNLQTNYFTPYVLVGYENGTENDTYTLTSKAQQAISYSFNEPWLGVGAIIPVNEKLGFRVDGRYALTHDTTSAGTSTNYKTDRLTATMYYNITNKVNLQLGVRNETIMGSGRDNTGIYTMLGFNF